MWRVLGSVLAWQMTASICYYAVFAATPFLREVFGLSRFSVGLVVTALTLGQLVFLLPVGAAIDGYGERRMLIAGLGGLSVGTVGIGIAWSFPVVAIAAFGLGAAYAVSMPGTNRAVFESIPPARRNLGMGIKQVGVTAGSACSSIAIPALAVAGATAPQLAVVICLALGFVMFGFTNVFFSAVGLFAPDDRVGGASAGGQIAINVGALLAPPVFGLVADGPGYRVGWMLVGGCALVAALLLVRVNRAERRRADTTAAD
jgi:MFS family permease